MANARNDLIIEDAELLFKNFEGREERYEGRIMNSQGSRNFHVIVPEDIVEDLLDAGWNVKILKPRDEGDTPRHMIKVNVSYRFREPEIHMYSGRKDTLLHEDTVANLDYADIMQADVVIHPSEYTKDDGSVGLSGYCTELRVVVQESHFADKYASYMSPEE